MIRISLVAALALLGGCFDSLLGTPCRPGYTVDDGRCVIEHGTTAPDALTSHIPDATMQPMGDASPPGDAGPGDAGPVVDGAPDAPTDAAPDAAPDAPPDAPPDGPTCGDTQTDPLNCGACGHACASGICSTGVCEGDPRGHVVAIGHDYSASNAPMVRVLGNAAALGAHQDLAIARWSSPSPAVTTALVSGLVAVGRTSHAVTLPATPSANAFAAADVIIIDPHTAADGDVEQAVGVAWSAAFAEFLVRGGVVIVLEGSGGTNYRFARGANLFQASAPVVVTGAHLQVVAGADAVTQQVISPYFAAASSVAFPNLPAVISAPVTGAVVFHEARP